MAAPPPPPAEISRDLIEEPAAGQDDGLQPDPDAKEIEAGSQPEPLPKTNDDLLPEPLLEEDANVDDQGADYNLDDDEEPGLILHEVNAERHEDLERAPQDKKNKQTTVQM